MNRIFAFGCSYTYGEGLPDCVTKKGMLPPEPSKYAWPSVLSKKTLTEVINVGRAGSSNKQILHRALDTDFKEGDTVIFLWTHWHRTCVLQQSGEPIRILPSNASNWKFESKEQTDKVIAYYKNIYDPYDAFMDDIAKINYIKYFLDNKSVKNIHFTIDKIPYLELGIGFLKRQKLIIDLPNWNAVKFNLIDLKDVTVDNMPDGHPGVKSQENIAHKVAEVLKEI